MDNLYIYNKCRNVPAEAQKAIAAGRLKGMTDINPMWRIKILTEMFGACGIGWYYDITNKWLENGADGVVTANIMISLYVKCDGEWSKPIIGIGGSSYIANEKNGKYTSDEAYKMALTDALSVSCKALGIGADVYYAKDRDKYTVEQDTAQNLTTSNEEIKEYKCCNCGRAFTDFTAKSGKFYSAGEAYHMAERNNIDGKARCNKCTLECGTKKEKR